MAYQGITTETGVADSLLQGALKINSNFSEIYTALGDGTTVGGNVVKTTGDQTIGGNKTFTDTVTTQTAFAGNGTIPVGGIIMWSGTIVSIPTGWALCDGNNGTPNLLDRFIVGAGSVNYNPGVTGGANSVTLGTTNIPRHTHGIDSFTPSGGHTHATFNGAAVDGGGLNDFVVGSLGRPYAAQAYVSVGNENYRYQIRGTGDLPDRAITSAVGDHTHSITISNSLGNALGGTDAHENRPPYYALAFIMRTT